MILRMCAFRLLPWPQPTKPTVPGGRVWVPPLRLEHSLTSEYMRDNLLSLYRNRQFMVCLNKFS